MKPWMAFALGAGAVLVAQHLTGSPKPPAKKR